MLMRRTQSGVFLAHNCTLTGDVKIGRDSSVWFNTIIRGDVAAVVIGSLVNVQDLALIHCDTGMPNIIEDGVTIGHGAIVHGRFVGRGSLIGMGATLLSGSSIGRECLIGAGAVVPPGMVVPDGSVVMGVPGRVVRQVRESDLKYMRWLPPHYAELARKHVTGEIAAASV